MNREQLIKSLENTFKAGVRLVESKNKDYAKDGDSFSNFRYSELAGVSVERAILVRVLDKLARVSNLIDKQNSVKDESLEDTLVDIINYVAILKAYYEHKSSGAN